MTVIPIRPISSAKAEKIKQTIMKKNIILVICMFISAIAMAQITDKEELNQRLQGKTKFYDIRNTVDNFYQQKMS